MITSAREAFLRDQNFNKQEKLSPGQRYTPHLPGVLSFTGSALLNAHRQLDGLSALFDGLIGCDLDIDTEKLAGVSQILDSISFELQKCYAAVHDESSRYTPEPHQERSKNLESATSAGEEDV